jgi:hypothetical protein
MKKNVGLTDEIVRVFIAGILVAGAYSSGIWLLWVIALVPLVTAVFGYCPLYALLGMSTRKAEAPKAAA